MKTRDRIPKNMIVVILCVVTIFMILGAVGTHARQTAERTECQANLTDLGTAMAL